MKVTPVSIVIFTRNISEQSVELWMQERQEDGPLDGLLEFPGGKIEAGECPVEAGTREVSEEVGLRVSTTDMKLFKLYSQDYEDRSVRLFSHLILNQYDLLDKGWRVITFKDPLKDLNGKVPSVNEEIINDVCSYIKEIKCNGTLEELWAI